MKQTGFSEKLEIYSTGCLVGCQRFFVASWCLAFRLHKDHFIGFWILDFDFSHPSSFKKSYRLTKNTVLFLAKFSSHLQLESGGVPSQSGH